MNSDLLRFDKAISVAKDSAAIWLALHQLSAAVVGHRLFTVTTVDMKAGVARRLHTDHPLEYPVSGSKPIHRDRWFEIVHDEGRSFVANSIAEIAQHFPDHELIAKLGCGSVINLPVVLKGNLVATVNMLDQDGAYGPEKVTLAEAVLSVPAKLCCVLAAQFDLSLQKPD
jgi:hypothetical protein